MGTGAVTSYIDVAQITLYVFWIFFALLVFYIRKEDRREGYPLEIDPTGQVKDKGFLLIPEPKTFLLPHGGSVSVPNDNRDTRPVKARRAGAWPGAPLIPTGDAMADGVGPAAWAERADEPDMTFDNKVKIRPISEKGGHMHVSPDDPNPVGMDVVCADRQVAGTITDIWADHAEMMIRYYEVKLAGSPRARSRLVPANCVRISGGKAHVNSILSSQMAGVPTTKATDQVTLLEEDKIMGYFAGGRLYATPQRAEPAL